MLIFSALRLLMRLHCQVLYSNTYVVVDEDVKFIFWVIQVKKSLEEFRNERSRLLDKYTNRHSRVFLFR